MSKIKDFMRNMFDDVLRKLESENICPMCQSIRFLVIASFFSLLSALIGALGAISVASFLFCTYHAWRRRFRVVVWFIKLQMWWERRKRAKAGIVK